MVRLQLTYRGIIEAALLALSLSTDLFVAFVAYGSREIRVPSRTAFVTSLVCTGIFLLFGIIGCFASPLLPESVGKTIGFLTLLAIGVIRIFDGTVKALIRRGLPKRQLKLRALGLSILLEVYADPETADLDQGGVLSIREGVLLAVAMSFDGAATGIGAAAGGVSVTLTAILSFLFCGAFIALGLKLGKFLSGKLPVDMSVIGGALLVILAVTRLL